MVEKINVIFGKGHGRQNVPNDAEEIYILGATLLESPWGPLCNRRDAPDEESLHEYFLTDPCVRPTYHYVRPTDPSIRSTDPLNERTDPLDGQTDPLDGQTDPLDG